MPQHDDDAAMSAAATTPPQSPLTIDVAATPPPPSSHHRASGPSPTSPLASSPARRRAAQLKLSAPAFYPGIGFVRDDGAQLSPPATSPIAAARSSPPAMSSLTAAMAAAATAPDTSRMPRERPKLGSAPASWDRRLAQRQKQIDYGKNTIGYQNFTTTIPRHKRRRTDPHTPDKNQECSTRSWVGQLRRWRRQLHRWDQGPLPTGASGTCLPNCPSASKPYDARDDDDEDDDGNDHDELSDGDDIDDDMDDDRDRVPSSPTLRPRGARPPRSTCSCASSAVGTADAWSISGDTDIGTVDSWASSEDAVAMALAADMDDLASNVSSEPALRTTAAPLVVAAFLDPRHPPLVPPPPPPRLPVPECPPSPPAVVRRHFRRGSDSSVASSTRWRGTKGAAPSETSVSDSEAAVLSAREHAMLAAQEQDVDDIYRIGAIQDYDWHY
ncbi:Oocyte-specific histone RNA stem-loop-binding protein 2 [Allomyces javanicus]|nr:Oocyte-specific histone RNA stem-loop-binding protein 2 [Allomyces javanicus]